MSVWRMIAIMCNGCQSTRHKREHNKATSRIFFLLDAGQVAPRNSAQHGRRIYGKRAYNKTYAMPCSSVWLFGFSVCNIEVTDDGEALECDECQVKKYGQLVARFYGVTSWLVPMWKLWRGRHYQSVQLSLTTDSSMSTVLLLSVKSVLQPTQHVDIDVGPCMVFWSFRTKDFSYRACR